MSAARHLARASVIGLTLAGFALLTACQSLPSNSRMLEKARADYRAAEEDPRVREFAKLELRQASDAMNEADRAWARNEDADEIEHMAYMAKQRVAIAQATAVGKQAEGMLARLVSSRERVVPVEAARMLPPDAELERHLNRLGAKTTVRGSVITIGDSLFDIRRTRLNASGRRSIDKLAGFLKHYPQRKARVEGFTDNAGSGVMNDVLSRRRAEAVRLALLERGVGAERIGARGHGAAFRIAGNDTAAGRRLNRRVEVVVSDDTGKFAERPPV